MSGSDRFTPLNVEPMQRRLLEALAASSEAVPLEQLAALSVNGKGPMKIGTVKHTITRLRPVLAEYAIPVVAVSGVGYHVPTEEQRAKLRVLLRGQPVIARKPARRPEGAPAKPKGITSEQAMAISALGAERVLAAERWRARGWSVKGIAKHLGVGVEPVKALFGVTGEVV